MNRILIGAREAAEMLEISMPIFYVLIKTPDFPAIRVGKKILVHFEGLDAWIASKYGMDVLANEVFNEEQETDR